MQLCRMILISGLWSIISLTNIILCSSPKKDYYELLGVSRDATDRQIKKAFHKLAMQYHPDKNKEKDAEQKFTEIGQAYEVLSDPEKRKKYDQFGHAAFDGSGGGGRDGGHFHFNFDDFFRNFDTPFGQQNGNGKTFHFGFGGGDPFMEDDFFQNEPDDDPFMNFGFGDFGSHFGSGDSFFGQHFSQQHEERSHSHHNGVHNSHAYSHGSSSGRSCRTVTQRIGNMVTTYTQCS